MGPGDRSDVEGTSLRSYVALWVLAGTVAVTIAAPWGAVDLQRDLIALLVLTLLTAAGEALSFTLRAGDSGVTLSLVETAVVIDLLLLPTGGAVIAAAGGVGLAHLLQRLPLRKLLFNVGMHAVAAGAATIVLTIATRTTGLSASRALGACLAILAYRAVDTAALLGVFSRIGAPDLRDHLLRRPMHLVATTLGNASLGVIAAALWSAHPGIVWIVAGPAVALYLAYGSGYRIEDLLGKARAERDRLDRVISGVGEGIVLHDADGTIRIWNAAMHSILGLSAERAVGANTHELLAGRTGGGDHIDPAAGVMSRDSETTTSTVVVSDTAGHDVPLRISHTVLRDDEGHPTGGVMVVQDLRREREAAALKEDFVARVSHELRTPLSPLRGYAQALRQAGDQVSTEKRNEVLDTIVERVGHLERLVDDLLLVSQLGSGRVDPARQVTPVVMDLYALVPRLVSWLGRDQVRDHPIVVDCDDRPHQVLADPMRVGQIVTNLLTNACKYSAPETPVTVRLEESPEGTRLVVEDRGAGIPDDKLETIFERFERLDDPQRMREGGMGLGLYISRQLAEAMGGSLAVRSERGVGSAFTLSLPTPSHPPLIEPRWSASRQPDGARTGVAVRSL